MLDISKKSHTLRTAKAKARVTVQPATIERIRRNDIPKGNPFDVAKVAAIQAAKRTDAIIPYCHPLPVDFVGVEFETGKDWIEIRTEVKAIYKTGVEMEALTAASVAALMIYDMLKMIDETMTIQNVVLVEKKGGKSDFKTKYDKFLHGAVLVMSDSISAGKKDDLSGKLIMERLLIEGVEVDEYLIIPDDEELIATTLKKFADDKKYDLVVTTGGTGFSRRDCTPEAMQKVIEREIPGIPEIARAHGQLRTPFSMLSRAKAGIRKNTLIVNLPGSKKGVADSWDAHFPALLHSFKMMLGEGHNQ